MTHDRLLQHYTSKYAHEADNADVVPLQLGRPHPGNRYEAAVAFLPPRLPLDADILEMGAGNGLVAKSLLAGGVPIASYTIGDISPPRLAGLQRTLTDHRFSLVEADAERASASVTGPFDAIVMIALIEHLIDPVGAMTDARSLLKPGGFVYIDTPNIAKWTRRIKLALGRFPSTASTNEGLTTYGGEQADLYDEGHLHYWTFRSLRLMLTEHCGFSRVAELGYNVDTVLRPVGGRHLAAHRPSLFSEIAVFAYG